MNRYAFVISALATVGLLVHSACASGELPARTAHDPANPRAAEAPEVLPTSPSNQPSESSPSGSMTTHTPSSMDHEHHAASGADAGARVYTCSMHAEVRQAAPGKCPKCGMELRLEKAP